MAPPPEYEDEDKEVKEIDAVNVVNRKYYGKVVFLKVPKEVTDSTKLILNIKVRNKEYDYGLN